MSVKILGGVARGYPLATPRSEATRPTSVMIKRKLFDWRQNLEGSVFIDLFAGSGSIGLEALSRGADKVYLNDSQRGAFLTLKDNKQSLVSKFSFDETQVQVSNVDAKKWVQREMAYQLNGTADCVLYLDPPFEEHQLYFEILELLRQQGYLGEVWLEADQLKGPDRTKLTGAFRSITKEFEQGDHFVVVGKLV